MPLFRYINRVVAGVIMIIPFFVILVPLFYWLDHTFEDNPKDYVTDSIIKSFWKLFKRNKK